MDDIARILPQHRGPHEAACPNAAVSGIEEDVGLTTTVCPACKTAFVYSFGTRGWIPEAEFEWNLAANPPNVAGM